MCCDSDEMLIFDTKMPGKGEAKERIFFLCAGSDVVDDERSSASSLAVAYNHDVGEVSGHGAGHQIPGKIIGSLLAEGQFPAPALEIRA